MTVKEAILKLKKKWRLYDQFILEVQYLLSDNRIYRSSQTIGREIRMLATEKKLIGRKVNNKSYKEFRRV